MRGVHTTIPPVNQPRTGSSPHARGPLVMALKKFPQERIIPACAGSTFSLHFVFNGCQDHPRMRGVHADVNL